MLTEPEIQARLVVVDEAIVRRTKSMFANEADEPELSKALHQQLDESEDERRHLLRMIPVAKAAEAKARVDAAKAARAARRLVVTEKLENLRAAISEYATAIAAAQAAFDRAETTGREIADEFPFGTLLANGGYLERILRGAALDQLAINEVWRVSHGHGPLARPDQVSMTTRHNFKSIVPIEQVIGPEISYILNVFDKEPAK